eukprot:SAG31_NODE_4914_length_2868_cov_1.328040_4_plen_202_part_00
MASVLAEDLARLRGLELVTAQETSPRAGDIMLALLPRAPPAPPSPPRPPPTPPPHPICSMQQDTRLNNSIWADPDGPRTATDAAACCDTCAKTAGCAGWSFQIDPSVVGKQCRWGNLTYCCWMHSAAGVAAGPLVPAGHFTTGTLPAAPKVPADLPAVSIPGWPSSAYTLTSSASAGISVRAPTEAGVLQHALASYYQQQK